MDEFSRSTTIPAAVYDAIVIGSGLTGGWAAKELSGAGLQVLVLEAGPPSYPEELLEASQWNYERRREASRRQPIQAQHPVYWTENPKLFVDDIDHPYVSSGDQPFIWIRGRQVGGRSLTWGGVTLRFSDYEFRAAERDGFGPSWPLSYQDLAPFYDRVERFLGVQGSREGLANLPDGDFAPPPSLTDTEQRFKRDVERRWKDRKVVTCRGIPLEHGTSGEGDRTWPPKASLSKTLSSGLAIGRVKVLANSIVSHLLPDSTARRIKGVACVDRVTKKSFEVFGRVVVLCASTIESVRIMLNSKSTEYPAGVGNSSGCLGRYLLDHAACFLAGVVRDSEQLGRRPIGGAHGIVIPKFRMQSEKRSFIRGYGIWGAMQRTGEKTCSGTATWCLNSILEVLPRQTNCVLIDENKVDAWGIKTVRIHMQYSENELRMRHDAEVCMQEMADAAHLDVTFRKTGLPGQYVHELGGARMGTTASTSVLNAFNQCWDAKNLFVVDGSCFVTSGWQNPTLTMMALAVRACEFMVYEMRRGNL
jgi:choline dehydrogenase-like flavoprotein